MKLIIILAVALNVASWASSSVNSYQVSNPKDSLAIAALPGAHYQDTFLTSPFIADHEVSAEELFLLSAKAMPDWVEMIQRVMFNSKGKGKGMAGAELLAKRPNEILMGGDTKHERVRLSFFIKRSGRFIQIGAHSVVQFRTRFGMLKWNAITKHGHRLFAPKLLKWMALHLMKAE